MRNSRARRARRVRSKKAEVPQPVPLQMRAAFANYLLHGMTPDQARQRVAVDMAETQECV